MNSQPSSTPIPASAPSGDKGIQAGKIWLNGQLVAQEEARVSVLSHALHYGSSVFEGIRAYRTGRGPAIFRLAEHTRRLMESAHILRMPVPYTEEEVNEAIKAVIRENGYQECYIRPLVFRGGASLGVNPLPCPVEMMVAAWHWGAYLGDEALRSGAKLVTSSWIRSPGNVLPTKAKAGGNYVNSSLAKADAVSAGFDEAILLDAQGYVAEGSGENLFFLKNSVLYAIAHSVTLVGITRDSIVHVARDLGYEVKAVMATRDELYTADEVFMTGTAAEVSPISSIDFRPIGTGQAGEVTLEIRRRYLDIVSGRDPNYDHWLTYVN
ncbi:branched-chain amino acid transaminase [Deinococcus peraridilitoris]|uniref:Branched-chain-amino-acid aminotransferase n=1 Tax=Deinococcus peraridilitoris (strain DSM 19664 / LMG 22246 / CIP 109416 / KR-200) TaxID=937777 RepID=L0A4F3_DEIPD|nr:branched-chain amino acid transaminase [Deinococcus peraridilitoris]AFZ68721.1 branched-chain amino acid aminotransferase, group I [Deinococcus peraridilitoris DSM 19664]